MKKRVISMLLTVLMIFSLFPASALAENASETASENAVPASEAVYEEGIESSLTDDEPAVTGQENPDREEAAEEPVTTSDETPDTASDEENVDSEEEIRVMSDVEPSAVTLPVNSAEYPATVDSTSAVLYGTFTVPAPDAVAYRYGVTLMLAGEDLDGLYSYTEEELDGYMDYFEFYGLIPQVTYSYQARILDEDDEVVMAGEVCQFTTSGPGPEVETVYLNSPVTQTDTEDWHLYQITFYEAGSYEFSAEGSGLAHVYGTDGVERDSFDSDYSMILESGAYESFWISCVSDGDFTFTVSTFTAAAITLAVVTDEVTDEDAISDTSAALSGTFSIPYDPEAQYSYGMELYLGSDDDETRIDIDDVSWSAASEMDGVSKSFLFTGLIPEVTYTYRAFISDDASDEVTYGEELSFTTAEDASSTELIPGEAQTLQTAETWELYKFAAEEEGDYYLTVSGSGSIMIYDADGVQDDEYTAPVGLTLFAEEGEVFWIYCCGTDPEDLLTIEISTEQASVRTFSAATYGAAATDISAVLSGEFNITGAGGDQYAYGIILYLNGVQARYSYKYTSMDISTGEEAFSFDRLIPGVTYTYRAVIRESSSWDIIAEGDEESFETAAAGSGVRNLALGGSSAVTEAEENSPLRFTADEEGLYQLTVTGNGYVSLYGSDGSIKEAVTSENNRLFTLEAEETVYIYCSVSDDEGVTLVLSGFEPAVTEFSAVTGDASEVTDRTATVSGTFSIPFTPGTMYSYGIVLYLNNTEAGSSTLCTTRETEAVTEEFEFTELIPGKSYTYKAVIFESDSEEVMAEGEEKSFETETAGSSVPALVPDIPVTPETPFEDTLYSFTPAAAGDYVISTEGIGVVRIFNSDGTEKTGIQNGELTILTLAAEDVIWLYCRSESTSIPLTVTVSAFIPTVTAPSAETGDADEITETSVSLSGTYDIPYNSEYAYEYGIVLYQDGSETDSRFLTTVLEEIGTTASFEFEDLIPGTVYTYQAVIRNFETGVEESTGETRYFSTSDTGDDIEDIALNAERQLLEDEGELYLKFTAAKSGYYKISVSGQGTATVYDAAGYAQDFIGADSEIILYASGGDVLWILCASEDDEDPLTVSVTLFTAKVKAFSAVTGSAADVTASTVSLSGAFSVPNTDSEYSCGIVIYAGGEEVSRDSFETGVELPAKESSFEFSGLLPGVTYTYMAFIEDNGAGETVAEGAEKTFTTAETDDILPLALDTPAEITEDTEDVLYQFRAPAAGDYTFSTTGAGYAEIYSADGCSIDSLYSDDACTLAAAEGEIFWIRCSAADTDAAFSLTVSVFTPAVTEFAAVTGNAVYVSDTEVFVEGTYSIPYASGTGIQYGAELYAGGVLLDSDLYTARSEFDAKTVESSFYGLVPGATYTYKAVIRDPAGNGNLAEGAEAQFTTEAASEEMKALTAGRNEVITYEDEEALYRFTAPGAGIWVFRLRGDGEAKIYGADGLLKGIADRDSATQLTLEREETVWLYMTDYSNDISLVLYISSDEAQIEYVPDGLWAIIYNPDGASIADFTRMDTGVADRWLTTQDDGDDILNALSDTAEQTSLIDIPHFEYTGKPITPVVHLYNGTELLDQNSYSLSYKNNTKASCAAPAADGDFWEPVKTAPQMIIKLKGNFSGSRVLYFNIYPMNLSSDSCSAADVTLIGTNKIQKVTPAVTFGTLKLKAGTDFAVSSATAPAVVDTAKKTVQVKDAGTYTVTLQGKGNYYGETSFEITVKYGVTDLSKASAKVTTKAADIIWTGNELRPDITVTAITADKTKITEVLGKKNSWIGQYFRAESENNVQPGKAAVTIVPTKAGEEFFIGSKTVMFTIKPKGKLGSTDAPVNVSYTGEAQYQSLGVYDKNKLPLREEYDYDVTYLNNVNAGTATVLYTGINGYAGSSLKKTFKITPVSLGTAKVPNDEVTVTAGDAVFMKGGTRPGSLTVSWGEKILKEGTDYTVKLANNSAAAASDAVKAPKVTVTGKGNFSGTAGTTFTITAKPIDDSGITVLANDIVWTGKPNKYATKVTLTDADGKALAAGTDYEKELVYTLGDGTVLTPTSPALGENTVVTVTIKAKKNYTGEVSAAYRVLPVGKDISKASFTIENQVYSGNTIEITEQSQFKKSVINKTEELVLGRDFEIVEGSYVNNVNKGTAKLTLHGIGSYGGYQTVSFKITARDAGAWWQRFFG